KGEYRITSAPVEAAGGVLEPANDAATEASAAPIAKKRSRLRMWLAAAATVLVAGNVAAWALIAPHGRDPGEDLRQSKLWTGLAHSPRPLLVVVGDYYIFGEYKDRLFLTRLIRDFSINSKDDLAEHYMNNPADYGRYSDVALQYLPASAAYALADISALFRGGRPVQVVLASELTPDKLKTSDIIYVGLFSGMGALRDPVFARSRFHFGDSYDQVIDGKAGKMYT